MLLKLLGFSGRSVFYIGGTDVLPPPLDREEERKMLEEYARGSQEARAVLIERNLRLVVYIAKKFENAGGQCGGSDLHRYDRTDQSGKHV